MDENYLLMSRDLCAVIGDGFTTGQLPFGPKLTFALNVGNLVPMLMGSGVHIFDDGSRICWPYGGTDTPCHRAWRGELKTRTHEPGPFCDHFVWSHWVKKVESFHMIYDMQTNRTDTDTMRDRRPPHPTKAAIALYPPPEDMLDRRGAHMQQRVG